MSPTVSFSHYTVVMCRRAAAQIMMQEPAVCLRRPLSDILSQTQGEYNRLCDVRVSRRNNAIDVRVTRARSACGRS